MRKAYHICDEANIDLKEEIKALRKELNERSWVTLEEQLTKAEEIINELLMNSYDENTREKALNFLYPDKKEE